MSSTEETRLHFEGVLDKHGKRFFEVGTTFYVWKFNNNIYIKIHDLLSHVGPNAFRIVIKEEHIKWIWCYNLDLHLRDLEESNESDN